MTYPYGGPPSYPGGPAPSKSSAAPRVLGALVMVVVLLATVVSFIASKSDDGDNASARVATPTFATPTGNGGGAGVPTRVPVPSSSVRPSVPSIPTDDPTSVAVPTVPSNPTPTFVPLDPARVTAVVRAYFDGFLYHQLDQVLNATCPEYRANYKGTYINGNEFSQWRSASYTIPYGQNSLDLPVTVNLRNPNTGAAAGTYNHTWVVLRRATNYYVCGYRV